MKPLSKSVAEAFDRFWSAYPKRPDNPKAPARALFAKLVKGGVDPEGLIAAATNYAAFTRSSIKDPVFIPHARTWLSQGRFEDYWPDAEASAPATEPSPEHPLEFMRAHVGDDSFGSWIAHLEVTPAAGDEPTKIDSLTRFGRDEVRRRWGHLIAAELGDVEWLVKGVAQ
jgi:hypothetical protein